MRYKITPSDYTQVTSGLNGSLFMEGFGEARLVQAEVAPKVGDDVPTLEIMSHGESHPYSLPSGSAIYAIALGNGCYISDNPA